MKISKLARLAKSSGQAVLYDTGGEQWLCVGGACYPLLGMPALDADTLPYALSLTEKEREKIYIGRQELPEELDIYDYNTNDIQLKGRIIEFEDCGNYIQAYDVTETTGETKAVLLDGKYLKPFEEYKDRQLYYRRTESLEYVVGMDGLNIIGALLPYRLDKEKLAENLSRLAMLISADE
nr:MAG TPA: hypothetical protein [Caudoviricetes sp.]